MVRWFCGQSLHDIRWAIDRPLVPPGLIVASERKTNFLRVGPIALTLPVIPLSGSGFVSTVFDSHAFVSQVAVAVNRRRHACVIG